MRQGIIAVALAAVLGLSIFALKKLGDTGETSDR